MLLFDKLIPGAVASPICPRCKGVIPSDDVNVAKDIAYCRNCNLALSLSALASGTAVDEDVDLSRAPAGAWFRRDLEGVAIGATNRSLASAFALLFFALFWNGIVSFFVLITVAATLHQMGITIPAWFPAAMVKTGNLHLGLIIFLWLFLTPFMAVGLLLLGLFLNCVGGRGELRLQNGQGDLFTGIGPIGFHQKFELAKVRDVRVEDHRWRDTDGDSRRTTRIVIETNSQTIQFGSMFTAERRRFVAAALIKELSRR
jgi:hypothetical protein